MHKLSRRQLNLAGPTFTWLAGGCCVAAAAADGGVQLLGNANWSRSGNIVECAT